MPTTFPDPSPQWAPLSHRGLASFLGAPTISESPRKNANSDPSGAQLGNRSGAGDDPTTLTCPPSNGTTSSSLSLPFTTEYATSEPSSDTAAIQIGRVP